MIFLYLLMGSNLFISLLPCQETKVVARTLTFFFRLWTVRREHFQPQSGSILWDIWISLPSRTYTIIPIPYSHSLRAPMQSYSQIPCFSCLSLFVTAGICFWFISFVCARVSLRILFCWERYREIIVILERKRVLYSTAAHRPHLFSSRDPFFCPSRN